MVQLDLNFKNTHVCNGTHTLHEQQKTHCVLASALEIDDVSIARRVKTLVPSLNELVICMSAPMDIIGYAYISSIRSLYNIYDMHRRVEYIFLPMRTYVST